MYFVHLLLTQLLNDWACLHSVTFDSLLYCMYMMNWCITLWATSTKVCQTGRYRLSHTSSRPWCRSSAKEDEMCGITYNNNMIIVAKVIVPHYASTQNCIELRLIVYYSHLAIWSEKIMHIRKYVFRLAECPLCIEHVVRGTPRFVHCNL